jgi:hypothetical protein
MSNGATEVLPFHAAFREFRQEDLFFMTPSGEHISHIVDDSSPVAFFGKESNAGVPSISQADSAYHCDNLRIHVHENAYSVATNDGDNHGFTTPTFNNDGCSSHRLVDADIISDKDLSTQ